MPGVAFSTQYLPSRTLAKSRNDLKPGLNRALFFWNAILARLKGRRRPHASGILRQLLEAEANPGIIAVARHRVSPVSSVDAPRTTVPFGA